MKKTIFIGNRINVFKELLNRSDSYSLVKVYAYKNSLLEQYLIESNFYNYQAFGIDAKIKVIEEINNSNFDILVSNGCPLILPISEMCKSKRIFVNVHPSYLPYLKGKTPINGIMWNDMSFFGATMHYMNDNIDEGNIIHQKKIDFTPDLDLGLLYFLSFYLEGEVFAEGLKILEQNNFNYKGIKQKKGTFFYRREEQKQINITNMKTEEISKRIKCFGIKTQGVIIILTKMNLKVYDAEIISNPFLLSLYKNRNAGEILLDYEGKLLLKTIDGIIKITRWSKV